MKLLCLFLAPLALVAAACGSSLPTGTAPIQSPTAIPTAIPTTVPTAVTSHTINGALQLTGFLGSAVWFRDNNPQGGVCLGSSGFKDISGGAAVTVYDASGKVIAVANTTDGLWTDMPTNHGDGTCIFQFTVKNVPASDFYGIEVSHRGQVRYSAADLSDINWAPKLTLSEY